MSAALGNALARTRTVLCVALVILTTCLVTVFASFQAGRWLRPGTPPPLLPVKLAVSVGRHLKEAAPDGPHAISVLYALRPATAAHPVKHRLASGDTAAHTLQTASVTYGHLEAVEHELLPARQ